MVLVDTSVWVEFLRRPRGVDLGSIVSLEEVVTCPPVVQEVLQGISIESAHRIAKEAMLSFPTVESPVRMDTFLRAAEIYRIGRRGGLTIRSSIDCLIAACAIRHTLTLLHRDSDFDRIAEFTSLQCRSV